MLLEYSDLVMSFCKRWQHTAGRLRTAPMVQIRDFPSPIIRSIEPGANWACWRSGYRLTPIHLRSCNDCLTGIRRTQLTCSLPHQRRSSESHGASGKVALTLHDSTKPTSLPACSNIMEQSV